MSYLTLFFSLVASGYCGFLFLEGLRRRWLSQTLFSVWFGLISLVVLGAQLLPLWK